MRKNDTLISTAILMAIMFLLAFNLPRDTGLIGALLIIIPYIWLSLFAFVNLVKDGEKCEKRSAE